MFFWKKSTSKLALPASPKAAPKDAPKANGPAWNAIQDVTVNRGPQDDLSVELLDGIHAQAQAAKKRIDAILKAVDRFKKLEEPSVEEAAILWIRINRVQTVKFFEGGRDRMERDILHSMNNLVSQLIRCRCPKFPK